jgi:hypothetical protein
MIQVTVLEDCSLFIEALPIPAEFSQSTLAMVPGTGQTNDISPKFTPSATCYAYQWVRYGGGGLIDYLNGWAKWYFNGSINTGRSFKGSSYATSVGPGWTSSGNANFGPLANPTQYTVASFVSHASYQPRTNNQFMNLYGGGYCLVTFQVNGYLPPGATTQSYFSYS